MAPKGKKNTGFRQSSSNPNNSQGDSNASKIDSLKSKLDDLTLDYKSDLKSIQEKLTELTTEVETGDSIASNQLEIDLIGRKLDDLTLDNKSIKEKLTHLTSDVEEKMINQNPESIQQNIGILSQTLTDLKEENKTTGQSTLR